MSIKKVVDSSGALTAATNATVNIVDAVAGTAWADGNDSEVPQGCTINSIFLSVFVYHDGALGAAAPIMDWYIRKNPGNALANPNPGATGGNENRRWILHEEKGLTSGDTDGGPPMAFKGVIKIPRGMRRMGRDDSFQVVIRDENYAGFFCVKAIYKFYQ